MAPMTIIMTMALTMLDGDNDDDGGGSNMDGEVCAAMAMAVEKVARAEETGKVKRTLKLMEARGPTNLAHEDSSLHV